MQETQLAASVLAYSDGISLLLGDKFNDTNIGILWGTVWKCGNPEYHPHHLGMVGTFLQSHFLGGWNMLGHACSATEKDGLTPESLRVVPGTEVVPRKKDGWQNNFCLCDGNLSLWRRWFMCHSGW